MLGVGDTSSVDDFGVLRMFLEIQIAANICLDAVAWKDTAPKPVQIRGCSFRIALRLKCRCRSSRRSGSARRFKRSALHKWPVITDKSRGNPRKID